MIKKVALGLAIVVIAIAGAAYYFASNLDSIVKAVVERYGSEATQSRVALKAVELSPASGAGRLQGLTIANPKGFASGDAIALGDVRISLDVASLQSNPIVIKEVVIAQPAVNYEYAQSGSNLEAIQKNVQAYAARFGGQAGSSGPGTGGSTGGTTAPAQGGGKADAKERKVIIERLVVTDGKIGISHAALQGRSLSSALPTIELKDIGKDKGGATPAEVADKVIGTIAAQANRVAVGDLQKQLGATLREQAGKLGSGTDGAADRLKGLLGK
jgi:uncharacterized protein involved in outer membrane biogenesis